MQTEKEWTWVATSALVLVFGLLFLLSRYLCCPLLIFADTSGSLSFLLFGICTYSIGSSYAVSRRYYQPPHVPCKLMN